MTSKKESPYKISLVVGEDTIKGKGDSIYQALVSLKKPTKITAKSFLTLSKGTKSVERMYMPLAAKRLFYPVAQQILAKQLELLLK